MLDSFLNVIRRSRVQVIDDDPVIHRLAARFLEGSDVVVTSAFDGATGMRAVVDNPPDLVLLDESMPELSGMEVLRQLRKNPRTCQLPIVFATGSVDNNFISQCFAAGATDFIRKPLQRPEFIARIGTALDRHRLHQQLESAAITDELTGLLNRKGFIQGLEKTLKQADESNEHVLAVLFIDFDRFKAINDCLGHTVGDQLLKEIAYRLEEGVAAALSASGEMNASLEGRFGGDEFVILLSSLTSEADASYVANCVLARLARAYHLADNRIHSSASIGVRICGGEQDSPEAVIRDADMAMYESKLKGGGCLTFFDDSMQTRLKRRLKLESDLHGAVERDELFLLYQPILSLDDQRVEGVEALVRWRHPELGLISPGEFIPIAEETGAIIPIGDWVLEHACRQFVSWSSVMGSTAPTRLSVNLSRIQVAMPGLADHVAGCLERAAMDGSRLQLEVTENIVMGDHDVAKNALQDLRDIGVHLAMDDFGTGYSSLACLHELPFDVVKVDRSFVANIGRSRYFAAILQAVTELAANLDLHLIAEGVETAEQLALLKAMDCHSVQGFFFGKPMPPEDFAAYHIAIPRGGNSYEAA